MLDSDLGDVAVFAFAQWLRHIVFNVVFALFQCIKCIMFIGIDYVNIFF